MRWLANFINYQKAINSLLHLEFAKSFTPVASKIPKFFNSTRKKRIYRDIFGQKLRMGDVLLIYFEQIVSFCAIIYLNTNSLQLFWEDSSLNLANFTDNNFSRWFLKILPQPKNILHNCHLELLRQIPSLFTPHQIIARLANAATNHILLWGHSWNLSYRIFQVLSIRIQNYCRLQILSTRKMTKY